MMRYVRNAIYFNADTFYELTIINRAIEASKTQIGGRRFFVEMNESESLFETMPLPGVFVCCFCSLRSAAARLALEAPPLLRPLLFMMPVVLSLFIVVTAEYDRTACASSYLV